jgi:hypothetical protein
MPPKKQKESYLSKEKRNIIEEEKYKQELDTDLKT